MTAWKWRHSEVKPPTKDRESKVTEIERPLSPAETSVTGPCKTAPDGPCRRIQQEEPHSLRTDHWQQLVSQCLLLGVTEVTKAGGKRKLSRRDWEHEDFTTKDSNWDTRKIKESLAALTPPHVLTLRMTEPKRRRMDTENPEKPFQRSAPIYRKKNKLRQIKGEGHFVLLTFLLLVYSFMAKSNL